MIEPGTKLSEGGHFGNSRDPLSSSSCRSRPPLPISRHPASLSLVHLLPLLHHARPIKASQPREFPPRLVTKFPPIRSPSKPVPIRANSGRFSEALDAFMEGLGRRIGA